MKITQEIRASAEAGMQEKSREFKEKGSEIYPRAIPNPWSRHHVVVPPAGGTTQSD